jgi:hypothetical protein
MAEAVKTFRVFVSSTFRDLEEERNILQEEVFPELKELCRSRGHRLQDIDLRWGVSEEASLDQQAMNICLREIERCREITPRPNFIVLLGNRHGWLALPPQITADEFEQIRNHVASGDQDVLNTWYAKDENAVPPAYYLRPREKDGPYDKYEDWEPVEQELHSILLKGVKGSSLETDPRFRASATEQEILAGAVGTGSTEGRAFAFVREIELKEGDPDPREASEQRKKAAKKVKRSSGKEREAAKEEEEAVEKATPILTFVDPDQGPIERVREGLGQVPLKTYKVGWDENSKRPTTDRLEELASDVRDELKRVILEEIGPPPRAAEAETVAATTSLDAELEAQRDFADERCRIFVGREDSLGTIARYLGEADPQPLVISGEGGTGKSALLAEALRRAQLDHPESELMYRFIGATPGSSDGRNLLAGLCQELVRRYGATDAEVPTDYQGLSSDFRERLTSAGAGRPLIVFLDSLDQLSASQGARGLAWLPTPLPNGVRMVVSTRPEDTMDTMVRRGAPVAELGPMGPGEGKELLRRWLAEVHRTLQPKQEQEVLARFEASKGNPLYLRLAFEEARRWKSEEDLEVLAEGVVGTPVPPSEEDSEVPAEGVVGSAPIPPTGIIAKNTFKRLAEEDNHGEVLVSHALGYLAASRFGLSEDELLDVLSRDPDVYEWFLGGAQHIPFDLSKRATEEGVSEQLPDWLKQLRAKRGTPPELRSFLEKVVPKPGGPRLPVVLWSRLAFDLRPYLAERAAEDAVLIGFFHRELREVAEAKFLADGSGLRFHGRLADYFRPELDGEDRRKWDDTTLHGLGELPYHLTEAGQKRWDDLYETLTDFDFLEAKASRVGIQERGPGGEKVYGGVHLLQDDFDLALRAMSGGEATDRPRIIVTATNFGEGMVIRCPHCNTVHTFDEECAVCEQTHVLEEWRGKEKSCTNPTCKGPLKVNEFTVGGKAS